MSCLFLSYCRADKDAIAPIIAELTRTQTEYWIDESDILPTMEFNEKILEGLKSCDWFLLVMTPRSAQSEYVKDELHWALSNRSGRIIPVMLERCEPSSFHLRLLRIQYVDLTGSPEKGILRLQEALNLVHSAQGEESVPLNTRQLPDDLEFSALLLTFISRHHQKHIRNLLAARDSERQFYTGFRAVRHELRDLCNWGLISRLPEVAIGEKAKDGRQFILSDLVVLTPTGRRLAQHVS